MGIFKFSDPMYMGSNVIVHQIQDFPYLLYIKLHLKMPGNVNAPEGHHVLVLKHSNHVAVYIGTYATV